MAKGIKTEFESRINYETNGFVFYKNCLCKDVLNKALQGVLAVRKGFFNKYRPSSLISINNPNQIQRITQIHHANKAVFEMLSQSGIGKMVRTITGAKNIKIWGSQLYYKPPRSGITGQVGFHCDAEHLPFLTGDMITGWIPLTSISDNSGPLVYVNESHKWQVNFKYSGGEKQNLTKQTKLMQEQHPGVEWVETKALLEVGDISFHHKDVLHCSTQNLSNAPRIAISFGIMTEKTKFVDNQEDYGIRKIINNPEYSPEL
ncbi:phytanoyl-CoA dioxygenase family protein [Tenacibaculum xiamenense]|uniref:phytanoyl-CoA dioxygenase family protein n=1 Tax=Tenacibaculum xiamenense TaxID=1261553 RepID=UPI003895928C